jgi:hypothetical protein
MEFFTSPEDLMGWVRVQENPDDAATKIMEIIGNGEEQDVVETCRTIFESQDESSVENASRILFGVLAQHEKTTIKQSASDGKMKKEAQGIQRGQAPLYDSMPTRICPKLPFSQGKRLISTWNCRHHCLDSIVFDDDPLRVYCAEALWRRHVMDKFSREWRNEKGQLVGGYVNERFQVYHEDGGNPMALAKHERTRLPRPQAYSIERRLEEGRGNETYDITASSKNIVKLASAGNEKQEKTDDEIYQIFSDIIEMKDAGLGDEEILEKVSDHYNMSVFNVAKIKQLASREVQRHNGVVYAYDNSSMEKTAQAVALPEQSTMVTKTEVEVVNVQNGQPTVLKMETPCVMVSSGDIPVFEIVDGPDAGNRFSLGNGIDMQSCFGILDDIAGTIQEGADELGLNDEHIDQNAPSDDFPIIEE